MSRKHHESGSDRIAEAVADMDVDIVVNVQEMNLLCKENLWRNYSKSLMERRAKACR
jgi:3-deoxy-manno-octulosonate cytidylyltransferase (CMP-KDO synthetase)